MLETLTEFFNYELYGVSARTASLAFGILFACLALRRLVVRVVFGALHRAAQRTQIVWDEIVLEGARPAAEGIVVIYGMWLAARTLAVPLGLDGAVDSLSVAREVGTLALVTWAVFRVVSGIDETLRRRAADPNDPFDLGLVPLITTSLRILVVLVFGTMMAQSLGYSVSALVASLGLGGAALALASRDAVANFFGFVMIFLDKPFSVGDWIKGSGFEGVVEEIGFRSTRIRTFEKTVENIPNNLMANVNVQNMDRRKDIGLNVRRIKMTVGVTYSTSAEQMEQVVAAIREILANDEGVDSRMTTLVNFTDFGASSLDVFIYYFSNRAEWAYYLDVRQRVNLKIMRALEELGVSIAFPSRSIYLENLPDGLDALALQGGSGTEGQGAS